MYVSIHNVTAIRFDTMKELDGCSTTNTPVRVRHLFITDSKGKTYDFTLFGETSDDLKVIAE